MAVSSKSEEVFSSSAENLEKHNENDDNDQCDNIEGNAGWADAMAKILGKQIPDNKPPVLIKYKKGSEAKKQKLETQAKLKSNAREKYIVKEQNHVKPDLLNDEHERNLKRTATKGVVKLFNAVNKHQKDVEIKLKSAPTEAKKAKVLKSVTKTSFLDILKNQQNDTQHNSQEEEEAETTGDPKWQILRDDFMMSGKMKDWDKEEDDDGNDGNEDMAAFDDDDTDTE